MSGVEVCVCVAVVVVIACSSWMVCCCVGWWCDVMWRLLCMAVSSRFGSVAFLCLLDDGVLCGDCMMYFHHDSWCCS